MTRLLPFKNGVLLSAAGVQRSGTPAQSKHPYRGTTVTGKDSSL
ncbi:MAG TPA: hypothetical protein VKB49_13170 [Candidatus Sulfotelmatobacter sp.]|nr:hypothetical protein [Candidatus Sulfotelmatobacter sp.]